MAARIALGNEPLAIRLLARDKLVAIRHVVGIDDQQPTPGIDRNAAPIDPDKLTIASALEGLARKDFTSVELTEACIAGMQAARPLNAMITETPDKAREMAKAADARRAKGEAGLLDGIPLAIKDLFATKGVLTTAARFGASRSFQVPRRRHSATSRSRSP